MDIDEDGLIDELSACSDCGQRLEPRAVYMPEMLTFGIVFYCATHGVQSVGDAFDS